LKGFFDAFPLGEDFVANNIVDKLGGGMKFFSEGKSIKKPLQIFN
jgi:hypothetical protein